MPGVDLVEPPEVVHVRVEDRRLDQVGHRRAGRLEHGGEVPQCLLGLRLDPIGRDTGRGVDPGRAGAEHEATGDDRLAVRTERGGRLLAGHCLSGHDSPLGT